MAEQFGLTKDNCPKHTSFIPIYFLETQMNWGWHTFALCHGEKIFGYMSLSKEDDGVLELRNLAVLPEFRHSFLIGDPYESEPVHADGVCATMKLGEPHAMDSFAPQNYRGSDS
ncbi:MAG: hypothetical protein ACI3XI_06225 [Eubacteriales bacterium]